jgi:hypothetical protein
MDYLSVCAIVKDENDYLTEWIEYHKLVGVERFFIYDNDSRIPIAQTLAQDISDGVVIVIPIQGHPKQLKAYKDCVSRFGMNTVWMAFIDIDEFICPHRLDDLRILLRGYEEFGALGIHWQMFGPSGHSVRPPGLQIENFLLKAPVVFPDWTKYIKTIAQPSHVKAIPNPHFCDYKGVGCVNEKGVPFYGPSSEPVSVETVQLNHYLTRSRSEFEEKVARGSGDGGRRTLEIYELAQNHFGEMKDESILRFAEKLRARLPVDTYPAFPAK